MKIREGATTRILLVMAFLAGASMAYLVSRPHVAYSAKTFSNKDLSGTYQFQAISVNPSTSLNPGDAVNSVTFAPTVVGGITGSDGGTINVITGLTTDSRVKDIPNRTSISTPLYTFNGITGTVTADGSGNFTETFTSTSNNPNPGTTPNDATFSSNSGSFSGTYIVSPSGQVKLTVTVPPCPTCRPRIGQFLTGQVLFGGVGVIITGGSPDFNTGGFLSGIGMLI